MVEIIKEANPDLNKDLFIKALAKVDGGVAVKIMEISDAMALYREKIKILYKLVNSKDFNDYYMLKVME